MQLDPTGVFGVHVWLLTTESEDSMAAELKRFRYVHEDVWICLGFLVLHSSRTNMDRDGLQTCALIGIFGRFVTSVRLRVVSCKVAYLYRVEHFLDTSCTGSVFGPRRVAVTKDGLL